MFFFVESFLFFADPKFYYFFFIYFFFSVSFFSLAAVANQTALDQRTAPPGSSLPPLRDRGRLDRLLQELLPADVAPRRVGEEQSGASLLGLSPPLKSAAPPPPPLTTPPPPPPPPKSPALSCPLPAPPP